MSYKEMQQEIASIMERSPDLYPPHKYYSIYKKFMIIEDQLFRMGIAVGIGRHQIKKTGKRKRYHYFVRKNMELESQPFKTRQKAKLRIFKIYLDEKEKYIQSN